MRFSKEALFALVLVAAFLPQGLAACPMHENDPQARQPVFPPRHLEALSTIPCSGGQADEYRCNNIDLMSFVPLEDLGADRGNDIWGWTDPRDGREYALMGLSTGTAFVDITDPGHPELVGNLATETVLSTWRDIKVFADHAFIVSEATDHGMQVFNLRRLRNTDDRPASFRATAHYDGFGNAHNIVLNEESGYAYAVGTSTCEGGLHMIDISNPRQPRFAGCFDADGYTHDAQCVSYRGPDPDYQAREICFNANEDTLTIVDVTDKSNPFMISRTGYDGNGYTHQGWATEDHALYLMDDEGDEGRFDHNARTYVWDIADLDAPTMINRFTSSADSIDHNQYVVGDHVFQANYTSGLRVLELRNRNRGRLVEVGYFDIFPEDDLPLAHPDHEDDDVKGDARFFNGAWSVYPFFASGNVVVSGIEQGLYVLQPDFAFGSDGGGDGGGGDDVCTRPLGHRRYCKECGPCGAGEGGCRRDNDCAAGLVCAPAVGAEFGFDDEIGVCVEADDPVVDPNSCARPLGHRRYCRECGPCSAGQGGCRRDSDCATGLVCAADAGAEFGFDDEVDVCVAAGDG